MGKWSESLNEIAVLSEQIVFLTRVAMQTNQVAIGASLAKLLDQWRDIALRVTVLGKIGGGAGDLAAQLAEGFGPRLTAQLIETVHYQSIVNDQWENLRRSAVIVCVVPSEAPLFDETQEMLTQRLEGVAQKVFVVALSADGGDEAVVPDIKQAIATAPEIARVSVTSANNLNSVLEVFLTDNYLRPLIVAMCEIIQPSARRLLPVVQTFADFLAMDQASFARRQDYVRRDLDALESIGQRATQVLETQNHTAIGGIANQIAAISTAMRQQAESMIQTALVPREVVSSQDARTRFGRDLTCRARSAGYSEFDGRVQAIAANMSSARSLLLSSADQMREEAEVRVEELRLNIGPHLFVTLLQPPLDMDAEQLMKLPLDPGENYAGVITSTIQKVRTSIPDPPFSSNWAAGRIESMFRSEMASNATSGWDVQTLDGPVALAVIETWRNTTVREAGLLIGRINALVTMLKSGLKALRLDALQIPKNPEARAKISRAFSAYAARLQQMGDGPATGSPPVLQV